MFIKHSRLYANDNNLCFIGALKNYCKLIQNNDNIVLLFMK